MHIRIAGLTFLLLAASAVQAKETPNYCLDPEANAEWASMLHNNPDDDGIARLFALRVGLCELVARDIVSLKRATAIFEQERAEVVHRKKREHLREQNKEPLG